MDPDRRGGQEGPDAGIGPPSEAEPRSAPDPDPAQAPRGEVEAESVRAALEKARRLVALELDLAETRRRVAEDNLEITEAPLELAEREIEELEAGNKRLRGKIANVRGG